MTETSHFTLGGDLLLYNSEFQVLICKECEYAVQPAAISRHLKQRHKIYRKDREDILEIVQHIPLVEPAALPQRELEPPVPCLTVLRGLYCTTDDCKYMCESLKRMQQHWAAFHNRSGLSDIDWKPTLMQTFFRGSYILQCSSFDSERLTMRDRHVHEIFPSTRRCPDGQSYRPTDRSQSQSYRTKTKLHLLLRPVDSKLSAPST